MKSCLKSIIAAHCCSNLSLILILEGLRVTCNSSQLESCLKSILQHIVEVISLSHLDLFQRWRASDSNNSNLPFLKNLVPPHLAGLLTKGLKLVLNSTLSPKPCAFAFIHDVVTSDTYMDDSTLNIHKNILCPRTGYL